MRQRLIRTVRKTVNQDSGKDVSAWAPGRPPIEAESAGQQTAGCHPRRQKSALVADSAPRCPRRWWWRWKEGPTRALPRTEVQPGAGRNRIGAGKVGSGLPVCPLPPTRSERPPHGKGQDGGGRARTVGAPGGPRAGNGPGLYFGKRRGRGPTNPRHGFRELVGWGHLPCPALQDPIRRKRGDSAISLGFAFSPPIITTGRPRIDQQPSKNAAPTVGGRPPDHPPPQPRPKRLKNPYA